MACRAKSSSLLTCKPALALVARILLMVPLTAAPGTWATMARAKALTMVVRNLTIMLAAALEV